MNGTPNTHLRKGWTFGRNHLGDLIWVREVHGLRYVVWVHPNLGIRTVIDYAGLARALGGAPTQSQDILEHMVFAEAWHAGLMRLPRPKQPAILMEAGRHRLADPQ